MKLHYYFTDEPVRLDDAMAKFLVTARSFASELEREKISQRTREHLTTKARRGLNAGGRCYGCDNVDVMNGERRSHVDYKVNADQAEIVCEIFTSFAAGNGLRSIAKSLNERGVPSPRADRPRNKTWAPSCIREMLTRERYRGAVIWGKTAKRYKGGTKVRVICDASDWTRTQAPHLRVVDEELWLTWRPAWRRTRSWADAQPARLVRLRGSSCPGVGQPANEVLAAGERASRTGVERGPASCPVSPD